MFKRKSMLYKPKSNNSYSKTDRFELSRITNQRDNTTFKNIEVRERIVVLGVLVDVTNQRIQDRYVEQYQKLVQIKFNQTIEPHKYQYCKYIRSDGEEFEFKFIEKDIWGYGAL